MFFFFLYTCIFFYIFLHVASRSVRDADATGRLRRQDQIRRAADRVPEPVRPQLQTDGTPQAAHIVRVRRRAQVQVSRVPAQVRVQLQHEEAHGARAQGDDVGQTVMRDEQPAPGRNRFSVVAARPYP